MNEFHPINKFPELKSQTPAQIIIFVQIQGLYIYPPPLESNQAIWDFMDHLNNLNIIFNFIHICLLTMFNSTLNRMFKLSMKTSQHIKISLNVHFIIINYKHTLLKSMNVKIFLKFRNLYWIIQQIMSLYNSKDILWSTMYLY